MRPLSTLRPALRNPRVHDVPLLEGLIRRFGFVGAIVLDASTGRIAAGHGRRLALLALHDRGEPPPRGVVEREGEWYVATTLLSVPDEHEAAAYQLADNRAPERSRWERDGLADMLATLAAEERAHDLGWSKAEVAWQEAWAHEASDLRAEHGEEESIDIEPEKTRQLTITFERTSFDALLPRMAAAQRKLGTSTYAQLLDALLALSERHGA